MSCVRERPGWPIQSPSKGRKKQAKGEEERNQIKFIDLRFERWQVIGLSEFVEERPWWPRQSPKKAKG